MPTTAQMLASYPDILLQVVAELRGAFLDGVENREQAIDLLAAQVTEPISTQMAFQEVADFSPQAKEAIDLLLKENGEMIEAQFSRDYGSIRQMGPAKLERETPWISPESVSELLYYYGLLGRGITGSGPNAHTIVYLPSDIIPWLPQPKGDHADSGLPIQPIPPPHASRTLLADDTFLEDIGTLLGFLRVDTLRISGQGPDPDDIDRLVPRLQFPFVDSHDMNMRLALLLHLAKRMGWLHRGAGNVVELTGERVSGFLNRTRPEQRYALWSSWRNSPEWNELRRTPGLDCTDTGNWSNTPKQTRDAVLDLLSKLQPSLWYSLDDFQTVVKETSPDFQRPNGNYDTWYIRDTETQEFLKGFEHWNNVEGALLRFMISGPLHWLGAVDLAEPSAGDDIHFSLSPWGAHWLEHDVAQPEEQPRRPLVVDDEFNILLALGSPLSERYRVERFALWQASYPQYMYKITNESLTKAASAQINAHQVLDFLKKRTRQVPQHVATLLTDMGNGDGTQLP